MEKLTFAFRGRRFKPKTQKKINLLIKL